MAAEAIHERRSRNSSWRQAAILELFARSVFDLNSHFDGPGRCPPLGRRSSAETQSSEDSVLGSGRSSIYMGHPSRQGQRQTVPNLVHGSNQSPPVPFAAKFWANEELVNIKDRLGLTQNRPSHHLVPYRILHLDQMHRVSPGIYGFPLDDNELPIGGS